ncbi:MAG: hypothetical protein ACI8TX_002252 [Hyphomicrobiaceae bacterium]|jgi:hypothetical protein
MTETHAQLFEPDSLLPEQYFAGQSSDDGAGNERQLMLAILRDAVECFQNNALARDSRGMETFDEADTWIFSEDREWPFSFENICDVLGVNISYVRNGLEALRSTASRRKRRLPKIVTLADRRPEPAMALAEELIPLHRAS